MSKTMKKPPSEALSKDREINPKIFIHSAVILEFVELSSKEDEFLFLIGHLISAGGALRNFSFREADALSAAIEDYLNKKKIREHVFLKQPLFNCTMDEDEKRFEIRKIKKILSAGESNE